MVEERKKQAWKLRDLKVEEKKTLQIEESVKKTVDDLLANSVAIEKAVEVQQLVQQDINLEVNLPQVRRIMK